MKSVHPSPTFCTKDFLSSSTESIFSIFGIISILFQTNPRNPYLKKAKSVWDFALKYNYEITFFCKKKPYYQLISSSSSKGLDAFTVAATGVTPILVFGNSSVPSVTGRSRSSSAPFRASNSS
ncbi:MAG: hypothetical protein RL329_900 [Bacteroidota bacterium]